MRWRDHALVVHSALGGCVVSSTVLLSAAIVYAMPSVTPVPVPVGWALGLGTLSLPLWAGLVAYAARAGAFDVPQRWERPIAATGTLAAGLFALGFLVVLVDPGGRRVVGDLLYLVGTVLLFGLTVGVVVTQRR